MLGMAALPACSSDPTAVVTNPSHRDPARYPRPTATTPRSPAAAQPLAAVEDVSDRVPLRVNDPESGAEAYLMRRGQDVVMRSATCTHQGCTVAWAADDKIMRCPCHGATYDAWTGEVRSGPAPQPLPEIPTTVRESEIYRV